MQVQLIVSVIIYLKSTMNKPFSPITNAPFEVQSYYFQLLVPKIISNGPSSSSSPSNYRFLVVDALKTHATSNDITITDTTNSNTQEHQLTGIKMNFVALSYNPNKQLSFALRMVAVRKVGNDKEIGQFIIDGNSFIDQFLQSQNGAFLMTAKLNDQWSAQLELYLSNSRYGLQKTIRDIKNPKPKNTQENTAPPIEHQRVKPEQLKRQKDEENDKGDDSIRPDRFKKFSPKKSAASPKQSAHLIAQDRKQSEQQQKESSEGPRRSDKSIKAPFVPKKEWLIPEAEEMMRKKTQARLVKKDSISTTERQKPQEKPVVKKTQPKTVVQQPQTSSINFFSPKIIISLLIILLGVGYLAFSKGTQSTPTTKATVAKPQVKSAKNQGKIKQQAQKRRPKARAK